MNGISNLTWTGGTWAAAALALGGATAILVVWATWKNRAPLSGMALKIAGVFFLAACLVEPSWTGTWAKPQQNGFALVADDSLSMTLGDRGLKETRAVQLQRLLSQPLAGWQDLLSKHFSVQRYTVGSDLRNAADFESLSFAGGSSQLGAALRRLGEGRRVPPLAGVLLFTDGQASDPETILALEGVPPVYPVVLGGEGPRRDLALSSPAVTQTAFEDAPVTVTGEIRSEGFGGEEVRIRLVAAGTGSGVPAVKPLADQNVRVPVSGGSVPYRFEVRIPETGVSFYRLQVEPVQAAEPEATLQNNEVLVSIDRGTEPARILYLGGRPNWEYKFLRRALDEDREARMAGLVRVAKREPRFAFRGRAGEASNPLFRGFGEQSAEETERFDKPVLVRLNAEDDAELRDGFPKTAEELFKYRAVILDDVEAEFFSRDQLLLLQRYVGERGGSLLVLGGMESFLEGNYARTPVGDLLPVYLEGNRVPVPSGPLRLELTREGWLQPWLRLRSREAEERTRLAGLPVFDVLNTVGAPKPGATVLATVSDGTGQHPALVAQRFGRGRSAALLLGDLWHSGLGDEARMADLGKAWRQLVRWLVVDVPEPLELQFDPLGNGEVRIQARVRNRAFEPVDGARVTFRVGSGKETWTLEASSEEPGVFEARFLPRHSGGYRVEAEVREDADGQVRKVVGGWATNLGVSEFGDLKTNRPLMEQLAARTGGRVIASGDLGRFVEELPAMPAPVRETWVRPVWHSPWFLGLALACLAAEWALRRRRGLA